MRLFRAFLAKGLADHNSEGRGCLEEGCLGLPNGFLRKSAGFCGFLRKSAVSCGFLRNSAPPKCCNSQEKRKSAKISENLRKTANSAPFVPFSLSLLMPPDSRRFPRHLLNCDLP